MPRPPSGRSGAGFRRRVRVQESCSPTRRGAYSHGGANASSRPVAMRMPPTCWRRGAGRGARYRSGRRVALERVPSAVVDALLGQSAPLAVVFVARPDPGEEDVRRPVFGLRRRQREDGGEAASRSAGQPLVLAEPVVRGKRSRCGGRWGRRHGSAARRRRGRGRGRTRRRPSGRRRPAGRCAGRTRSPRPCRACRRRSRARTRTRSRPAAWRVLQVRPPSRDLATPIAPELADVLSSKAM